MPLKEVEWLKRIALGTPKPGEGHTAEQKNLCLGIVPWAPVPSGAEVLEKYLGEVEKHAGESFAKIRGFRYLVQDKPKGTMLQPKFIEGLKLLGRKGYVFDVGVDQRSGGKWQLEEAVKMIELAHEDVKEEEKVTFIISKFSASRLRLCVDICQTISANRTCLSTTKQTPLSSPGERPSSSSASAAKPS